MSVLQDSEQPKTKEIVPYDASYYEEQKIKKISIELPQKPCEVVKYENIPDISGFAAQNPDIRPESADWYVAQGSPVRVISSPLALKHAVSGQSLLASAADNRFTFEEGILYRIGTKKNRIPICNFVPVPKKRIIFHLAKGKTDVGYEFLVSKAGHSSRTFVIHASDLDHFYTVYKKKDPGATLYHSSPKAAETLCEYVATRIGEMEPVLKEEEIFETGGWFRSNGGNIHYFSALDNNCHSSLKLAELNGVNYADAVRQGLGFLTIAQEAVSVPIFLMAHSGFARKLLVDAGEPPEFFFDIIAETGSRKTSVAKILCGVFQNCSLTSKLPNQIELGDTGRSMELVMERNKDGIVLLDDLRNPDDPRQLKKFDDLLRQCGDSAGRGRSVNGGKDLDSVEVDCTFMVTAEKYFQKLQTSSKLRNVALFMNRESIDNKVLKYYQDNARISYFRKKPTIMEIYMTVFIRFLERHYEDLVQKMIIYEPSPLNLKRDRMSANRRALHLLAFLVTRMVASVNAWKESAAETAFLRWCSIIDDLILQNQRLIEEEPASKLFLQAINTMVMNRELIIADSKQDYFEYVDSRPCIGFCENNEIKLYKEKAYSKVLEFYKRVHYPFNGELKDIAKELVAEGYANGYSDRPFKSVSYRNKKGQFLCLFKDKFDEEIGG